MSKQSPVTPISAHTNKSRRNTIPIPEVPSEPCLLLCPHVMLLSLAFADDAFAAPALTGPKELAQLRVPAGLHQLPVPIKSSKSEIPLFRRVERNRHGRGVSQHEAATDQWFRDTLRRLSDITGFELPAGPYCFRRGAGEALDSSSTCLSVTGRASANGFQVSSAMPSVTRLCSTTTRACT